MIISVGYRMNSIRDTFQNLGNSTTQGTDHQGLYSIMKTKNQTIPLVKTILMGFSNR